MHHRLGHLKDVAVDVGDVVLTGEKIGTLGNTGNSTGPHVHYDIMDFDPKEKYTQYVDKKWTREEVRKLYADPGKFLKNGVPTQVDHYGWKYLETASYSGTALIHPGVDLNGKGNDEGQDILSPIDGVVVYAYKGGKYNGGWGNMVVIKEYPIDDVENLENYPQVTKMAEAIKHHEGWKEAMTFSRGSVSFRNNNPGNFRYNEYVMALGATKDVGGYAYFQSYEMGWNALRLHIYYAMTDQLRQPKPTDTLLSFFEVYAPSKDNNNPRAYAEDVAKRLGVTIDTQIGTILAMQTKEIAEEPKDETSVAVIKTEEPKEEIRAELEPQGIIGMAKIPALALVLRTLIISLASAPAIRSIIESTGFDVDTVANYLSVVIAFVVLIGAEYVMKKYPRLVEIAKIADTLKKKK